MRREQVLKICLNHYLTKDMEFLAKDNKTWLWTAADFSEGVVSHDKFCIRFKTPEIAVEFKEALDKAQKELQVTPVKPSGNIFKFLFYDFKIILVIFDYIFLFRAH